MRRTILRVFVAAAAVGVLVIGATSQPARTATCTLTPVLKGYTLNQGIGDYANLARNKQTLLRVYLSKPSCAGVGSDIKITSGSATISNGSALPTTLGPTPSLTAPNYPSIVSSGSAPAIDSPGDLIFVIRPDVLTPGTTGSFTLTVSNVTLGYQYKARSTDPYTSASSPVTFTTFNGSAMSRPVAQQTKALGMLVVKMARANAPSTSWFGAEAQAAMASGMSTASRIYPVPAGVSSVLGQPGAGSSGIRYQYNDAGAPGAILDLSQASLSSTLLGGTTFCGKASNFAAVQSGLDGIFSVWNSSSANVTAKATADRVIGAVDRVNSSGGTSGCADGMAMAGTPHSWVRALYSPDPIETGALLVMESSHSSGDVPTTRDDNFSTNHDASSDGSADVGFALYRTYNTSTASYISGNRTVMKLSGTWLDSNTLFSVPDWAFHLCKFGGPVGGDCTDVGSVGTGTAVAAGPAFVAWGQVNKSTGAGAFGESYLSSNARLTQQATSGEYWIRLRSGGSFGTPWRTPVQFGETHHDNQPAAGETADVGTFAVALPFNVDADRVQLCKGPSSNPCETVLIDTTAPGTPSITSATVAGPSGDQTAPGTSRSYSSTVTTTAIPPMFDLFLLQDETGSFIDDRPNVATQLNGTDGLVKALDDTGSDYTTGVAGFRDFARGPSEPPPWGDPGDWVYRLLSDLKTKGQGFGDAVPSLTAGGGGDVPEAQLEAAHYAATPGHAAIDSNGDGDTTDDNDTPTGKQPTWRGGNSKKVMLLATDAACHVQGDAGGWPGDSATTSADTTGDILHTAGIKVIGLVPDAGANACMSTLATKTGGSVQSIGSSSETLRDAILAGLGNLEVTVTHTESCSATGVSISVTPAQYVVESGNTTDNFTEQISVGSGVPAGTYQCTIHYLVDGVDTKTVIRTIDVTRLSGPYQFVQALVSGPPSADLKAHLTLTCSDGLDHVIATMVPGVAAGGNTKFFVDTSAGCPGGAGTFSWGVTNGVHLATKPAGTSTLSPTSDPLVANIDNPTTGTNVLQFAKVALNASVKPTDASVEWFVDGTSVGTDLKTYASPPPGGWSTAGTGIHSVLLRATLGSQTKEVTSSFVAVADANFNGVPANIEACAGGNDSPGSADVGSQDSDNDGISTIDEIALVPGNPNAACDPNVPGSYDAQVDLDDILFYVAADFLRANVTFKSADARNVDPATIEISKIAGYDVSGDTRFDSVGYTVSPMGVGAVKWKRTPIIQWLKDKKIVNETVYVTVSGKFKNGRTWRGFDTMRVFLPG
jgi:hypothetical protein